jgi:carboxyl-terminal processing protease
LAWPWKNTSDTLGEDEKIRSTRRVYLPIVFALLIIFGMLLGTLLTFPDSPLTIFVKPRSPVNKITQVLNYVNQEYVDTVNKRELTERTLSALLQSLDPHSDYMTAEEFKEMNAPLKGNFEGVGIEFNIFHDTVRVLAVVRDGPSDSAGIKAGDRIISVEGKNVAGIKIASRDIKDRLTGEGGTTVKIGILRGSEKKDFVITRGTIPIFSVEARYMVNSTSGYIRLSRFSETTHKEFTAAAGSLLKQGMKSLILDLRENGGGILDEAAAICDEFLEKGKLIVYTRGKNPKSQRRLVATDKGSLTAIGLAVLIDENSASASEIVAGAIQDNDRGLIVGRRSFGKGLVQTQAMFGDSSAIRLTIARYYTPTGRCIQKPYGSSNEEYYNEEELRYRHGELIYADSIHFPDSLKYKTPGGKTVYGGGGIMPDIFVPLDTSGRTAYLNDLLAKGLFTEFALGFLESRQEAFKGYGLEKFTADFSVEDALLKNFTKFAADNGLEAEEKDLRQSLPLIRLYIKAHLARQLFGNDGFYFVLNSQENAYLKAAEALSGGTKNQ